ncbi:MAG: hypothetical protein ACREQQ_17270 [Candidatus Binatia bacterium]
MTKRSIWLAIVVAATVGACGSLSPPWRKRPAEAPARDVARTEPREGEEEPTKVFDEATRRAALEKRFPGSQSVDLVRVLTWTADRAGACWSETPPPWEIGIKVRYDVAESRGETAAAGIKELREQGWLALYRTPNGSGFERRGEFRSIDLTMDTEFRCRCSVGTVGAVEEKKLPTTLRFRWQGKGRMPEVSAAVTRGGKKEGLPVAFAPGHLMSYEFPVVDTFPAERAGKCGGTVALSLLSTPPMQ